MRYLTTIFLVFWCFQLHSQTVLHPSIGVNELPGDNDSVCFIPWYLGSFYTSGLFPGDTAADFKLYSLSGDSIQLSQLLSSGKPVLLIAGSYTCPVFRNKMASINNMVATYGGQVNIAIIYTIEAHPVIDTSVYFGYVQTGSQNINEGILYRQPVTYGERKLVVTDMLNDLNIQAPVYLDGPCNNWWSFYGPAPNNAYLIDTTGIIFAKHGWYDRFPDDISCDLDSLLGNPVNCPSLPTGGSFTFNMISNDTVYSTAGSIVTLEGELVNTGASDVLVEVRRMINSVPVGWATSLCLDACYSTTTDSVSIWLPAGGTQHFYFYVYTTAVIDTSRSRVGFRNSSNTSNQFTQNLFGITTLPTSITETEILTSNYNLYPNPMVESGKLNVKITQPGLTGIEITDITGRKMKQFHTGFLQPGNHIIPLVVSDLSAGVYILTFSWNGMTNFTQKLVVNH